MIINWYGEGCFKIQVSGLTLLTDPFESSTGLTPPRFKADIVLHTVTPDPLPALDKVAEERTAIGPGEYETKGIDIVGWPAETNKAVYLVKTEDLRLCFLGQIAEPLPPAVLEKLDDIDILFAPTGGKPFLTQEAAVKLIKQIEPKIVVASFFKVAGLKRKADDVKDFLKEIEQKAEPQEKLTVKKKDLTGKMQVAVLKI